MQNPITIKTAKSLNDAKTISLLAKSIWVEHYTTIIGLAQVEYMTKKYQSTDQIHQDITQNGYTYYIAYSGEKAVGYAAIKPDADGNGIFLSKLYIDKNYRGQKISKRILEQILNTFQDKGAHFIWLTVNKKNTNSISAYQKMGYKIIEEIVTDIGEGYVMDDFKMRLEIN